ncbi:MAG: hypothetical protein JSW64_14495 [Candidatus Zixiibacteriota bacterium]|nr:MAG: hypothetical protein JSW64_14495 [candidate division Zixibacteria bacterium]
MDWVAIISALIAFFSALASIKFYLANKKITWITNNYNHLIDAEKNLKDYPALLRFHGIENDLLSKYNTTAEEVVYLLLSFRAGQLHSRIKGVKNYGLSKYRVQMLDVPKVREIWKNILYGRLILSSKFARAVNNYINEKYS